MSSPLYSQPRRWHSARKPQMRSLFSLLNVKYEPPTSRIPRRPTSISTESVTGPCGPSIVAMGCGVRPEQVVQPTQLGRIVPVHPHPEPDRLLRLASGVGQDALLAQGHELGDAVRLDVALRGEAQVTLDVDLDPQALAVEAVLVALVLAEHRVEALVQVLVGAAPGVVEAHRVVRRDRPVEEAPAGPAGVLRAQSRERLPLVPERQDVVLLADEIRPCGNGVEHPAPVTWRVASARVGCPKG